MGILMENIQPLHSYWLNTTPGCPFKMFLLILLDEMRPALYMLLLQLQKEGETQSHLHLL